MKTPHNSNQSRTWLKVCLTGCCLLMPFLLGAGDVSQADLESHRKQIETMSSQKRNDLKNKYQTFQKLPSITQQELRNIHNRIEKERRLNGKLPHVVDNYFQWLGTLSPWQREEIRKQSNSTARIRLIREFKEQQEKSQAKYSQDAYTLLRVDGRTRKSMRDLPRLSDDDLEAAMQVVLSKIEFPQKLSKELSKKKPTERYILILKALHQTLVALKVRSKWPSNDTIASLSKVISDSNFHRGLSQIQQIKQPQARKDEIARNYVSRLILKSILQQWQKDLQQNIPSKEELTTYYKSLNSVEREQLMEKRPAEVNKILMYRYRMKHDPVMKQIRSLRGMMKGGPLFRGSDRKGSGKRPPRFNGNDRSKRPAGKRP